MRLFSGLRPLASRKRLVVSGAGNSVRVGRNVSLVGSVEGCGNEIDIGDATYDSRITLVVRGDRNRIRIRSIHRVHALTISCGPARDVRIEIGRSFTFVSGTVIMANSRGSLTIGDDCLVSGEVTVRCGEAPHLVFDRESGAYHDFPGEVEIGAHVWIGEKTYLTKRAAIPSGCIVAACSVVTKRFDEPNVVLAGNPAQVVKRGIHWARNPRRLEEGSLYKASFEAHRRTLEAPDARCEDKAGSGCIEGEDARAEEVGQELVQTGRESFVLSTGRKQTN